MIDLDERSLEPADLSGAAVGRLKAKRKMMLRLVAAFVAGGVLGGVGVSGLQDSRQTREAASVLLVTLPSSADGGASDVKGVYQMDGHLAVINVGPASISVRSVTGEGPGVMVRYGGQSRSLHPRETGWLDVKMRIECSIALQGGPVSMRFSVDTADRQVTEVSYPVDFAGSAWGRAAQQLCEQVS